MDFFKKLTSSKKKSQSQSQSQSELDSKLYQPNPNAIQPKGILKNKNDAKKYSNINAYPTSDDIDESLRNAQKNSSLNQSIANSLVNTQSVSPDLPQNEEMKQGEKEKKFQWDEANLQKNEEEKVPRMKIDEAPTPYNNQIPMELIDNIQQEQEEEEIILDQDPMEMFLDENDQQINKLNNDQLEQQQQQQQQQQQSLLLQDDQYRQKMVNDALNRRRDENQELSEQQKRKEAFKKKRKNHYNEFHAIKAWKAKQQQGDELVIE